MKKRDCLVLKGSISRHICTHFINFPRLFKEGTDFMRSIKSGVVKLRFNFFQHSGNIFKHILVLEVPWFNSWNNTSMFLTPAWPDRQANTQSKTHAKNAKKNIWIMQISTLITSLREALGGFACPSGQAGVKNTLKMALSTFYRLLTVSAYCRQLRRWFQLLHADGVLPF